MKISFFILLLLIPFQFVISQETQKDADMAFQNAKKGIIWVLSNIPENKSRVSHDLIAKNKLVSSVKLEVEVNGVKVNSTGFYNTTEVNIKLYRSIDSLKKEGYLKNKRLKQPGDE